MSSENYVVITAANCPTGKRQGALTAMPEIAQLSKSAGAARVSFGMTMSGLNPGALVFLQFFDSLSGFENVMRAFQSSSIYSEIIQDHEVTPYLRNVVQLKNVPYQAKLDPMPNYLVMSKGTRDSLSEAEVLELLGQSANTFTASGAQSMRFGQIITGSEVGQYLLGVTYPSMDAIEKTYTALASDAAFGQLSSGILINMRSIIRLHSMV
jgi:hypothetical protein